MFATALEISSDENFEKLKTFLETLKKLSELECQSKYWEIGLNALLKS